MFINKEKYFEMQRQLNSLEQEADSLRDIQKGVVDMYRGILRDITVRPFSQGSVMFAISLNYYGRYSDGIFTILDKDTYDELAAIDFKKGIITGRTYYLFSYIEQIKEGCRKQAEKENNRLTSYI